MDVSGIFAYNQSIDVETLLLWFVFEVFFLLVAVNMYFSIVDLLSLHLNVR